MEAKTDQHSGQEGILATAARANITKEKLDAIYEEVQSIYLSDQRPWVLGYSGGKDSTATLQVVWCAIERLPKEQRLKQVYVLSSDTLVETPPIINHVKTSLQRINKAAQANEMPFEAHKVMPQIQDSFWVNLIGRGYPAPSKAFRWCTERMKIDPTNRFVLDKVAEYGEVVVILGARKQESASRAQVLKNHKMTGSRLNSHTSLPKAYVYTPIEEFSLDDVWSYLLTVSSPWGNDNKELVNLYLSAQAGECPLVIDTTTPSCGSSRFGCWVCTVVTKDKAIESLIDNGEEWMEPMLELRDWLAETQDPQRKREFRDYKRRDGKVMLDRSKQKLVPGPYYLKIRKQILRQLLEAQKLVRENGPNPEETLIETEELHEIRRLWRMEEQDWEDSVPQIYRDVTGEDIDWLQDDAGAFTPQDMAVLQHICEDQEVPVELVSKLLDLELELSGMGRRTSIYNRIDQLFKREWKSEDEAMERAMAKQKRKGEE